MCRSRFTTLPDSWYGPRRRDAVAPAEAGFTKDWNGMNDQGQPVSSGVYFYKLMTKNFTQTKKMVLLK